MAKQRTRKATDEAHEDSAGAHEEANGAVNGAAAADGAAHPSSEERMRRAEEMVDRMAERIGTAAGWLGHGLLRLAARAREEAEDIWAEACSLSRGERAQPGAPGEGGRPAEGATQTGQ